MVGGTCGAAAENKPFSVETGYATMLPVKVATRISWPWPDEVVCIVAVTATSNASSRPG